MIGGIVEKNHSGKKEGAALLFLDSPLIVPWIYGVAVGCCITS
jgi:hypothetical protein